MAEWDNAHFLTKGQDLTPTFGALASAVEQAIEQAQPASTWYGPVIYSEATPPVVAPYEYNKRGLWQKISTKRWYYYNTTAGSWDNLENALVIVPATGSITLSMIDPTGADPLEILRRNAAGTGFEWVGITSIIGPAGLSWSNLPAGVDGDVVYNTGGVWGTTNLSSFVSAIVTDNILPVGHLYDQDSIATAGQVPYFAATHDFATLGWVDQLLRDNYVATKKLLFASGAAGKYPKVNAGGTDFDYDTGPSVTMPTVATLVDTGVSGTAPQSISATTLTTIRLAAETSQSWCVVAANKFTLSPGTYFLHAVIPVTQTTTANKAYIALVATGSGTKVKTVNVNFSDNDTPVGVLIAALTVSVATQYEIDIYSNDVVTIGNAGSFASIPEVYSQVMITKLT